MTADKLFCVGQKAFIDRDGEVLVLNSPKKGVDFPGGKIQEDEPDFDKSLQREVREETGLEIEVGEPFTRWYYEPKPTHRNYGKKIYLIGFKCKYKSGEVSLSDEHDKFRWVDDSNFREVSENSDYFKALEMYFKGA